jgi:transposase InsO family protein
MRDAHSIKSMCFWLAVSRSGYYRWRSRKPSVQHERRERVQKAVVHTFHQYKKRYGSPRVTVELNESGIPCSLNHVATLMSESGLRARNGKAYKYFPSPNKMNLVNDNLLQRDFKASKPNEKWVSDITYIRVKGGNVYLAVIMDLYSRKIIGWALDESMPTELIAEAFNMAVATRKVKPGLVLHSDRGVQYRSGEYQRLLLDKGVRSSMSRKGNCWDNAAMESFFGRMKVESIHKETFKNLDEVYSNVFEYIELFYNNVRRHSHNGYKSPKEYEQNYYEKCA